MIDPVRHLAALDGTWCGEPYDASTCTTDPDQSTCLDCLSHADDYGDIAKRAYKKLALRLAGVRIYAGVTVEWDAHRGTRRAVVDRIENGDVYIRWPRRPTTRNPKPYQESFFEAGEIDRLRVVGP